MKIKIFNILFFLLAGLTVYGQATSDAEAEKILSKLGEKYDAYKGMQVDFEITMQIAEKTPSKEEGRLQRKGDHFRLEMKDKAIFSDGESLWLHLLDVNEVQINNAEDSADDILSPNNLLQVHKSRKFIYRLTHEGMSNGVNVQQIELKPKTKDEDYSKIRLTIDKKKKELLSAQVFFKDGSRYILEIKSLSEVKDLADSIFKFDESKFPGVYVEDLRI